MRKFVPIIVVFVLVLVMLSGCKMATQNVYKTNLDMEAEVAAVMEKYDLWYQLADAETRAQWDTIFKPAFDKLDLLMDTYHNMVESGMTTETILREIDLLKTRIMIELVNRQAGEDEK